MPPGYFAVTGTIIQPSQHNSPLEDIAQALTDSLPRDGSAGMTGDLPMGANQITGLGAASAGSHAPRWDQTMARSGAYPMTGNMDLGGFKITNSGTASGPNDIPRYNQVMARDGQFPMTGPLVATAGTIPAPGVQFANTNNGIAWVLGEGPIFTASGAVVGRLKGGTALDSVDSIVKRDSGDARYMRQTWTLTAGNGMTGGGDGSADRTLTMGTPSSITDTSTNSVTATSHTHALSSLTVRTLFAAGAANTLGIPVLCRCSVARNTNDTTAGSNLVPSSASGEAVGSSLSGTWQCLGTCTTENNGNRTTLFMRIA